MNQKQPQKYTSFSELRSSMGTSPNSLGWNGVGHVLLSAFPADNSGWGRVLSLDWRNTFNYPGLGIFSSVSNLKYWLTAKDHADLYRTADLRGLGRLIYDEAQVCHPGRNWRAILIYAKYLQLSRMTFEALPDRLLAVPWVMYKNLGDPKKSNGIVLRQAVPIGEWYGPAIKSVYRMLAAMNDGVQMNVDEEMHKIVLAHKLLDVVTEPLPYVESFIKGIIGNRPPPPPPEEGNPTTEEDDASTTEPQLSKKAIKKAKWFAAKKAEKLAKALAAQHPVEPPQTAGEVECMKAVDQEHATELGVPLVEEPSHPFLTMSDEVAEESTPVDTPAEESLPAETYTDTASPPSV